MNYMHSNGLRRIPVNSLNAVERLIENIILKKLFVNTV